MAARVYIHHYLAEETNGQYFLPLNAERFLDNLMEMVPAPASLLNATKPVLV